MTKYHEPVKSIGQQIIETCCEVLGCTEEDIIGLSRREPYVNHRKIIAVELRSAGFSLNQIGRLLGRHYSTVIWSTQKYHDYYQVWPEFRVKADACAAAVATLTQPEKIYIQI